MSVLLVEIPTVAVIEILQDYSWSNPCLLNPSACLSKVEMLWRLFLECLNWVWLSGFPAVFGTGKGESAMDYVMSSM